MFAIVNILGDQIKVLENNKYYVPRLKEKVDSEVTFNSVLMVGDSKNVKIGTPEVKGAKVTAKVLEHIKDDKVIVFKKKIRKSYKKKAGHRQQYTKIEILKIS
ncbi:MAG: 50S ribosomal protein L21 [Ignavibacteriota bacterium]|jgi:large subunit ribosomal protein L21|nr:MAG: 50S ribosomal protein L21 [Chlorobiota bacterium]MBE7477387.1 50S ribosomal protein L21 [Ignavibacteriales bacterium]MBL1122788.1 50S ribosomal protein L21 [Ignavibacteriota bacterium]MBV6421979.1 50S ribosomal protein L21 [Ignavibacteriaceae bacterium]MCE7855809.1 50S ribosomal protein L21 [Ignavibacteria bacterium CHB3]MEB2296319.1 50S ribosomal protein L21 [Ignavibacteria bacterium]